MSMNIKYQNSAGDEIDFKMEGQYPLISIDGRGTLQNDLFTRENIFQDGSKSFGRRTKARNIVLRFWAFGWGELYAQREYVSKVFSTKLTGAIIATVGATSKRIDVEVENITDLGGEDSLTDDQAYSVSLLAPYPFWYNPVTNVKLFPEASDGFQFNWSFPLHMKTIGAPQSVSNQGTIESPIILEVEGPAVHPILTNITTGEKLDIDETIANDEKLIVNTKSGEREISVYSIATGDFIRNAYWKKSYDSTFFLLRPGENSVKFTAFGMDFNSEARISYNYWYVGI